MDKIELSWAAASEDGGVVISGIAQRLEGLTIVEEIGRGANAVVFEAVDQVLRRRVAVKIWNARGVNRAEQETAKIAQLSHPLIVTTHQFHRIGGHPYSVMEYVDGSSGKQWLARQPSIEARILVWQLYSQALRFIHDRDFNHGDPHLGNVLIFDDPSGIYKDFARSSNHGISLKLADTGTSEFLHKHDDILRRESKLIHETAQRLFAPIGFDKLWHQPQGLPHRQTLRLLDAFCEYVLQVHGFVLTDWASQNADRIVDMVMRVPLLDIDEALPQIVNAGFTDAGRFARRLNAKLLGTRDFMDANDQIDANTRMLYLQTRDRFIASLAQTSD